MFIDLPFLSQAVGWIYFIAWSISFYPQIILNYREKVNGLSCEFLWYNVLGFTLYSIYSQVKYDHQDATKDKKIEVHPNDLFFCYHALVVSSFTIIQTWWYGCNTFPGTRRYKYFFVLLLVITAVSSLLFLDGLIPLLTDEKLVQSPMQGAKAGGKNWDEENDFSPLLYYVDHPPSLVYIFGLLKIVITATKYVPQAVLNVQRKSTVGWSIGNIWLDFTGGALSFCQIAIDSVISGNLEPLIGNPTKLCLSILSISFDLLFLTQHYVFYAQHGRNAEGQDGIDDDDDMFNYVNMENRHMMLSRGELGSKEKYSNRPRLVNPLF